MKLSLEKKGEKKVEWKCCGEKGEATDEKVRAESRLRPIVGRRNSAGQIVEKFRNGAKYRNREQEK